MRWALMMIRLAAACRNTSVNRTTGTAPEPMMSANTCPGPAEGNWSISPTINSAALSIRVERITWGVYVLAGILAELGGLAITGYVGAISANQGNGLIFTVFAAAVIGGISLDGGKGTMFGALTGVLLLGVVGNLLTLAQVPSFWIQAIYGAIILGSLMVARFAGGAFTRARRSPCAAHRKAATMIRSIALAPT